MARQKVHSKDLVACGRIGCAVGLRGESVVFWGGGESPVEVGGELIVVDKDSSKNVRRVAALRRQGRFHIVRFEGVRDRTAAEELKGSELYVSRHCLKPLADGEYYCYQILGLDVVTGDGRPLGKVVKIFTVGENDVYEVMPEGAGPGREILIPAIRDVIISINLKDKQIKVRPLKGMLVDD